MVVYRRIKTFSSLMLVLHFTAAALQQTPSFIARAGDEVTLRCENLVKFHHKCDSTSWIFSQFPSSAAVSLFERGQFTRAKQSKLSVTENCSLVIQKVTDKDAGLYFCQQSKSGPNTVNDYKVQLSVVEMTEHEDADVVTLKCNVWTRGRCIHKVKWLFKGKDVDEDNEDLRPSQSTCLATITFKMSHFIYSSKTHEFFKCNVTDGYSKTVQLFTFGPQSSGATPATPGADDSAVQPQDQWWVYVVTAVAAAALIITALLLIRWKRNKVSKTQRSKSVVDREDGVSYASISHQERSSTGGTVWGAGDVVTYSAVKAPSSSADPTSLYATVS